MFIKDQKTKRWLWQSQKPSTDQAAARLAKSIPTSHSQSILSHALKGRVPTVKA